MILKKNRMILLIYNIDTLNPSKKYRNERDPFPTLWLTLIDTFISILFESTLILINF